MAATAAAGVLLTPIAAQAHTDSLGYILTAGSADGIYNVDIVYGSWHEGNIAAEGSLDLYKDGVLLGNGAFSILLADVADGALPAGLTSGENYFYADGDGLSATPIPGASGIFNFQSTTFLDLEPGTYTFGYAAGVLTQNWTPSGNAINNGTFIIRADGSIGVPGIGTDIDTAEGSYGSSQLGIDLNPAFKGGTLAIDEDGETYANNFTLDNSGTNTIDATGNTTTLSGTFSDEDAAEPGGIIFQDSVGGGEVVLTGINTHTGGTTLNSGILTLADEGTLGGASNTTNVNGGTLNLGGTDQVQVSLNQTGGMIENGSIAVDDYTLTGGLVAADATIDASTGFTVSQGQVDGTLTGGGTLEKIGAGTVVLAGTNDYTGGTTITEGTLQIGDGGTTGSIVGDIANDGALVFNRSDDVGFGGFVSGSGSLTQAGAGVLTLTGDSDYSGGTTIANGALQLGNGGTTGSITGDVVNNGTLIVNRSNAVELDGVISGSGGLIQAGSGTTTLSGPNSYAGGTLVQAGILAIEGEGTLGAATGSTVVTGGALDLGGTTQQQNVLTQAGGVIENGRANVDTYQLLDGQLGADATVDAATAFDVRDGLAEGTLTGTGTLTKSGPGAVVLAGTNDYSGGTAIEEGLLVLGNGGTSGSIAGDVANDGGLVFNRSDDVSFDGAITGSGFVAQIGEGATRLVDGNSYEGGTFVGGGTLIGSASSFGSGPILNEAALVIDQAIDADFTNALGGAGSLTKTGAGTLNLVTDSSLSGPTILAEGGLAVNASFANSGFTAEAGTVLSGSGTIGGLIVRNSATLATGNAGIGTLGVAGNVLQESGSTWQVELASTGETDALVASGSAEIADGAVLNVTKLDGQRYDLDGSYTVLSADGGVSGTYTLTGDTHISAFFDLVDNYGDPNSVVLNATQTRQFNELDGLTRNQTAAAGGAQSLGLGNELFNAIAYLDSEAEARDAFGQVSGEIHSSAKSSMIEDSRFIREAVNLRLRGSTGGLANGAAQDAASEPVRESGVSLWGHGFGSWGHIEGQGGNAAKLNRSIGGLFVGADGAVGDNWRIGALGGYSRSEFKVRDRSSTGETDNYHLGAYAGGQAGPVAIRLGAAYSWHKLDTTRSIAFTGFADSLDANYKAQTAQVFGELAHRFDVNGGAFEPFAQLAYVHLHSNGFTEKGGAAALTAQSDNANVTFSTLGLRMIKDLSADGATSLYGSMGWRHAFGDRTPLTTLRFASGSDAFTVAGTPIAQNAAAFEAGVDRQVATGLSIGIAYSGQVSSRLQDHGFKAVLGWKF